MLSIVNESSFETPGEIESRYPRCKYIFTGFTDLNDLRGHLYAVSDGADSFDELCGLSDQLADEGINCCIMGEYAEGGMIGVLREFGR